MVGWELVIQGAYCIYLFSFSWERVGLAVGCWCGVTKFLHREGSVGGAKEIEWNCIDKSVFGIQLHCIASSLSS